MKENFEVSQKQTITIKTHSFQLFIFCSLRYCKLMLYRHKRRLFYTANTAFCLIMGAMLGILMAHKQPLPWVLQLSCNLTMLWWQKRGCSQLQVPASHLHQHSQSCSAAEAKPVQQQRGFISGKLQNESSEYRGTQRQSRKVKGTRGVPLDQRL